MQYAMIYSIYIYRVHTCTVYKYVGHSAVYDRIISRCMTRVIHIIYRLYVTSQSTARPSRTEILLHPAATPGQPTGQLRPAVDRIIRSYLVTAQCMVESGHIAVCDGVIFAGICIISSIVYIHLHFADYWAPSSDCAKTIG